MNPAGGGPGLAAAALAAVAFVAGAAALLFETLWYRTAGLVFGNGIWASSLVLAAFMAGLALGSGVAARLADRAVRPLRLYAGIELAIGASAAALVAGLPALADGLAPLFARLRDAPALLNASRLLLAFALLTIPATAMGATLPVLVRSLSARAGFGAALGRLYGWNTLGAVLGALLGEALLLERLGLRGTALAAGALNATAAGGALWISTRTGARPAPPQPAPVARRAVPARTLLAAFAAGAAFLALEVVWFRFLSIFVYGTALVFAVMLATVLAGIGLGGLAGGRWLARPGRAAAAAPAVALLAGAVALLGYAGFGPLLEALLPPGRAAALPLHVAALTAPLVLPTALLSGLLFTALAGAARESLPGDAEATGLVALANTLGAALGALAAGFLLLPQLGLERSLLLLAAGYAAVALLAWHPGRTPWRRLGGAAAVLALAFAVFPSGALVGRYLGHPHALYREPGSRVVLVREGPRETLVLLENQRLGETHHRRILSNAFSMAGDPYPARRYMKAFVYLPVALHPAPRRALLVSYGIGSTARALADTAALESIDVVDISPDILALAERVFPEARNPLRDPRVRTFVEDGRFFLKTSPGGYDLITSEPSPPKLAGVVNLFTREYFALLRARLAEGGLVSYWLPIHDLSEADTRAVLAAFCDVFPDCAAFAASGLDWLLLGSRGAQPRMDRDRFARQWSDPRVAPELAALGFERPEQLLATFVADAADLAALAGGAAPLVDDFPLRLSHAPVLPAEVAASPWVRALLDPGHARDAFRRSRFAAERLSAELRDATLPWFEWQALASASLVGDPANAPAEEDLVRLLRETPLRTLPLWLLGSDATEQTIAARLTPAGRPDVALARGIGALAAREYARAARELTAADGPRALALRALAHCLAGEREEAERTGAALLARTPRAAGNVRFWRTLEGVCGASPTERPFHPNGRSVPSAAPKSD